MRRRQREEWFSFPVIPFLAIMLGLISVMSIASVAVSFQRHREVRKTELVRLTNIPPVLIPLHIRCKSDRFIWYDLEHRPHTIMLTRQADSEVSLPDVTSFREFHKFITSVIIDRNKKESFNGRQFTFIIWTEPDASRNTMELVNLLDQFHNPLRTGLLPIMPNEKIKFD